MEYAHIMPEDIFKNPEVKVYVEAGNSCLGALGFTEHGRPHAKRCSNYARNILEALDYDKRTCELAAIAGYLHDIGNTVNRVDHAHSGAIMAFTLLTRMNMPPEEIAIICSAIGHHDEKTAFPVNAVSAALILSDKSDVRRSRVRKNAIIATDIHDRVNYAVVNASLKIDKEHLPRHGVFRDFPRPYGAVQKGRRSFGAHVRAYHQRHASAVIRITPIIPRIGAAVHTLSNCGSFVLSFVHFFAV